MVKLVSVFKRKKGSRGRSYFAFRSAADIDGEKSHDDLLSHWKLSEIISNIQTILPYLLK